MSRLSTHISPIKAMEYVLSRSMEYHLGVWFLETLVAVEGFYRNERFHSQEVFNSDNPTETDKIYAALRAVRRIVSQKKAALEADAHKKSTGGLEDLRHS